MQEYFLGLLGVNDFFSIRFSLARIYYFDPSPPPFSITFPMVRRDGNYVMEAQFVFLFLLRAVFGELFNEWTSETLNVIVQDKIDNKCPWSILLSIIKMTRKRSKICSETIRLLIVVSLECRPWKFSFDLYKGREKRTHFFRKVKKN